MLKRKVCDHNMFFFYFSIFAWEEREEGATWLCYRTQYNYILIYIYIDR